MGAEAMQLSKYNLFHKQWKIDMHKVNPETDFILKNINSKWNIDVNVKCKTIKLLEDKIGENQHGFGQGNDFWTHTKYTIHDRINKLDFIEIKIKTLYSTKDTVKIMRRPGTDLEKVFAKTRLTKDIT